MASKRKPLEDARRRLNDKLSAIEEQVEFIENSVNQLTAGVRNTAQHLLAETNKTKFFNKYRAVSQELEKCLDDLLLISATISSLDDQEEEEDESGNDEDDGGTSGHAEGNTGVCWHGEAASDKEETSVKEKKVQFSLMPDTQSIAPESKKDWNKTSVPKEKEHEAATNQIAEATECQASVESTVAKPCKMNACHDSSPNEVCSTESHSNKPETHSSVDSCQIENSTKKRQNEESGGSEVQKISPSSKVQPKGIDSHPPKFQQPESCENNVQEKEMQKTELFETKLCKTESVQSLKSEFLCHKEAGNTASATEEIQATSGSNSQSLRISSPVMGNKDNILEKEALSPTDIFAGDVIEEALKTESNEVDVESPRKKGLSIPSFKFPEDSCLEVAVTEIISPSEFWIQQTNGDLDCMMEEMCIFFSKRAKAGDKGGLSEIPSIGDVCCGRFTEDNVWYRVLVTAVSAENSSVDVLYVDEGNKESLPLSRLRPLEEKFKKLPCQASCCKLSGVQFHQGTEMEEVNDWFKRRVSGETLEAVLAEKDVETAPGSIVPIHLYIRPPGETSTTEVKSLKLEYNIREMMIREGFSQRVASPSNDSVSVSPSSSHSDVRSITKADSLLSASTATSGFHEDPCPSSGPVQPADPQSRVYGIESGTASANVQGCHGDSSSLRVPPPVIPVDYDGSLFMLVSHVVNPGEFYVHFITSEAGKLDTIMEDMNRTYEERNFHQDHPKTTSFSPRVGDFCCAKFTGDGNWYRAVVLQVRYALECPDRNANRAEDSHEKKNTITVEVFYIDFGNTESVGVENLRELLPRFLELPVQVVRCSLADVQPIVSWQEVHNEVFAESLSEVNTPGIDNHSQPKSRRRSYPGRKSPRRTRNRNRSRPVTYDNAIPIAAGDEDPEEDDLLNSFFLLKVPREKVRSRSSISEDIEKSRRTASLSDTAVELFDKVWSGIARPNADPSWSKDATEFFKSLTKDSRKLVGFVVPWDSEMVNNIVNYSQGVECSLPNLGPVLSLNLYDVSGDEDVFINGAMVKANFAISPTIMMEEDVVDSRMNIIPSEETRDASSTEVPVVKMNEKELSNMAQSLDDSVVSNSSSGSFKSPSSPTSPTMKLLEAWNPMSSDYESFRNAYSAETDNLDVAITGYKEDRGNICRFYRSKYGCFRGNKCPNKHVQQDVTGQVLIYSARSVMSVVLPDIGAWVAVKVTAIHDPGHFWVQMPFGKESLDSQIIKSRSGKETSGEENLKDLDDLMKKMSEFYSKTFRRERSLVPATEGELVALRYESDNQWYRGKICLEKDDKYKVCFVDYGFSSWIDKIDICPMIPQFLHLPFQAVECCLANVKPKVDIDNTVSLIAWSKDSRSRFQSLVEDKVLVCQILSTGVNGTMFVNLFATTEGQELNISQEMIDSGVADEADFMVTNPIHANSLVDVPG